MLIDVLTRVSKDTGLSIEDQRNTLIDLLQESADLMWSLLDCNKIHREITLVVPPNQIVALPNIVGELKGIKEHSTDTPVDLEACMTPKFVSDLSLYKFKNWRDLGESPIHTDLNSVDRLTIVSSVIESTPVTLKVLGQTNLANRVEEEVVLNVSPTYTTKLFGPAINAIVCLTERTGNIVIKQSDGTEIATLYNNESKTRYKLIDVSEYSWQSDTALGETFIDLCYKIAKTKLLNDADSFYAGDDYDDAWYHFAMFHFLIPIADKAIEAMNHRGLGMAGLKIGKEATESAITKKLNFGDGRFYNLFPASYTYPGANTKES